MELFDVRREGDREGRKGEGEQMKGWSERAVAMETAPSQ